MTAEFANVVNRNPDVWVRHEAPGKWVVWCQGNYISTHPTKAQATNLARQVAELVRGEDAS